MRVQAFGSEFAIERFDEGVISGLARPGEVQRDAALIAPQVEIARDEFAALIDADCLPEANLPATSSSISTTSGPRKVNRASIAAEKRENVSMIVSTRSLRPVAS